MSVGAILKWVKVELRKLLSTRHTRAVRAVIPPEIYFKFLERKYHHTHLSCAKNFENGKNEINGTNERR